MSTRTRLLLAIFVAPLAVAPAVFVALPLYYLTTQPSVPGSGDTGDLLVEWLGVSVFMTVFGSIVAFFAVLVVGVPVYGILRYFDLARPLPCALFAAVIGLVGGEFVEPEPAFFSLMGICAAAVAAAFCRLANGPENRA